MENLKKILAPTDLSETSLTGVRYALDLARISGAEATIYHVIGPEELRRNGYPELLNDPVGAAESELHRFLNYHCEDLLPFVETRTGVDLGMPEENIVKKAKASHTDLIVLATHGRTGLTHVLLGSVAERVVRNAECPVLTIRPARFQKTLAP